jgi:GntR family histidine utilization transcriptional repressor
MTMRTATLRPLYQVIKAYVIERVLNGQLKAHARVPSEHELVREFGVSRATVNRAIKELEAAGIVVRKHGAGTFVAPLLPQSDPLEIYNIADQIKARGRKHHAVLLHKGTIIADAEQARAFQLPVRAPLFSTRLTHFENNVPIQFEDRLVNPMIAPDYLADDFSERTPHQHLMRVAPFQRAEHTLRATLPPDEIKTALKMAADEPCLLLLRKVWSANAVASCARFYYPASRYEFAGRGV